MESVGNLRVGDRVRFVRGEFAFRYKDDQGNFAEAEVVRKPANNGLVDTIVKTGPEAGRGAMFVAEEIELIQKMEIVSVKRSNQKTGLKIYGKLKSDSGETYNFAYIRRSNFRGWICSCENFFFTMFKKNRNCKHLKFVRQQIGRYGTKVPSAQ